jgi:protein-S-isoprenylcysteine O-methyltransferase Ste14
MVGLRTADIFLQYGILAKGLASPLLNTFNVSQAPNFGPAIALGMPLKPLLVLAMAAGSSIKQSYWLLFVSREEMPPANAILISVFNTIFNSANSILSLTSAASAFTPSLLTAADDNGASALLTLSSISYFVGLALEAVSEQQRKAFKDNSKNAGKLYTGGLFGLARHINYAGYIIWRSSYALASGGWVWGALVAAFFSWDFANRAVPVLDKYCASKVSTWRLSHDCLPMIWDIGECSSQMLKFTDEFTANSLLYSQILN